MTADEILTMYRDGQYRNLTDALEAIAAAAWDEGYVAKEDYGREYSRVGLEAVGGSNPYRASMHLGSEEDR